MRWREANGQVSYVNRGLEIYDLRVARSNAIECVVGL